MVALPVEECDAREAQQRFAAGHKKIFMQQEFRDRQRKNVANMRMIKDITMAILILGVAMLLFFAKSLNMLERLSDGMRISLGVLFSVYGAFRLYRGIKRDY
jgi:uncharacterized membrane protein